jgi:hypothetical protein
MQLRPAGASPHTTTPQSRTISLSADGECHVGCPGGLHLYVIEYAMSICSGSYTGPENASSTKSPLQLHDTLGAR